MCWEPRTVEVHHYINNPQEDELAPFSTGTLCSSATLPVTLCIYSESRLETLRHYSLAFAAWRKPAQVYFNFNIDCLYIREADMYRGASFASTFPLEDIRHLQRLAILDCYVHHLLLKRQRLLVQPAQHPLCRLVLENSIDEPISVLNMWKSHQEVDVVVDGDKRQRDDRISSWVKEGHYICVHCAISELRTTFKKWRDGPKAIVEAYSPRGMRLETNSLSLERRLVIRQEGHIIFMSCCRLRPNDLLKSLRMINSPLNKAPWTSVARAFGLQVQKCRMPCRCRLENYLFSEGMASCPAWHRCRRAKVGELGRLCKKWVHRVPLSDAH
jgi:hypothetical protein